MKLRIDIRTAARTNARPGHWGQRAKHTKAERMATRMAIFAAGMSDECDLPVTVRLVRVAPCALDDDNVRGALKAVRDEMASALRLASDRDPRCRWLYGQRKGKVREYAVEVEVVNGQRDCAYCGAHIIVDSS